MHRHVYLYYMLKTMSKKILGLKDITHLYKNYLFDLDGVIVTII